MSAHDRRPPLPSAAPVQGRLGAGARAGGGAALVFLVVANLRPSLTAVGPLLPQIGDDLGLAEAALGLLGAVPLLAFALVSPVVHRLSGRLGADRSILLAMLVLAGGVTVRSSLGTPGLWTGTLLAGIAIAVGNVLVPALVKRDFAALVSRATGVYTAVLTIAAAAASAIAVPLAAVVGWRHALAVWAVPALLVAALWLPRARATRSVTTPAGPASVHPTTTAKATTPPTTSDRPGTGVWRRPTAWLLTALMGLQSTTFYVMVTWLPTIDAAAGATPERAGLHLFGYQLVGIAGALAIPRLMNRDSQVAATVTASVPMLVGVVGMLLAPGLTAVWALVAGLGSGAALTVVLSLISLRGRDHHDTTRLSGMAQSVGYLLAAAGPVAAGALAQATGGWTATLLLLAGLAAAQVAVAVVVGADRRWAHG